MFASQSVRYCKNLQKNEKCWKLHRKLLLGLGECLIMFIFSLNDKIKIHKCRNCLRIPQEYQIIRERRINCCLSLKSFSFCWFSVRFCAQFRINKILKKFMRDVCFKCLHFFQELISLICWFLEIVGDEEKFMGFLWDFWVSRDLTKFLAKIRLVDLRWV